MRSRRPSPFGIFGVINSLTKRSFRQNWARLCLVRAACWLVLVISVRAEASDENRREQARPAKENYLGSFAHWQTKNTLNGNNGALENPDGDAFSNLVEFTLGQPADSGMTSASAVLPKLIYNPIRAKFDFEYQRRKNLPTNLKITLLMTGYDGYEEPTSLVPVVSEAEGDFEKVVYSDLESDPFFQGQTMGKVRLQVSLDAETEHRLDSKTALWCWRRHPVTAGGSRSFAMPLVRQEVYRGRIAGMSASVMKISGFVGEGGGFASALLTGESYYVEVMEGPLEGQRWEVDEPSCTAGGIALDLTSSRNTGVKMPDFKGMIIAVRPHQTVGNVIRTDRLLSATRFAEADRVQFWDREQGHYTEYWLSLRASNVRQWVLAGDLNVADAGSRVLLPDEGLFIKCGRVSASLPLVGLCREADLIIALEKGTHFLGTGWIDAATPGQMDMLGKRIFSASSSNHQADRFRIWNNQSRVSSTLAGYYLRASSEGDHEWVREGDADLIGQNQASLLNAFEAFFIIHPGAPVQWRQPSQALSNESLH